MSSPPIDALRHAASAAYVVLDDDDRVMSVSASLHESLGGWVGHVIWEHLPGARKIYGPTFDDARSSGQPVESVVFYSGKVKRLTAIPGPDGLAVHVERLAELDLTSLATLTQTLAQVESALAHRASARSDSPAPASLQALP